MPVRAAILLLFCLSFVLIPVFHSSAVNVILRVNEAATKVSLRDTSAEVSLAVENLTAEPVRVKLELEWLDPKNYVPNRLGRVENIAPGASKLKIPFPLGHFYQDSDTPWFRLRYRITSDEASGKAFAPVTGIISLSEMASEMFELHVIASEFAVPGKPYRAQIRASHPVTAQPVAGVRITSELKFDNDAEDKFASSGTTDRNGFASLNFNLPKTLKPEDGTLTVTGKLGEYLQEAEFDLNAQYAQMARMILTTDKPLYQPGQTLHIRALAMDFHNRAILDTELEIEIEDPENATQFRADLKTSRFGVANVDWKIPDNTRLGDFQIVASLDDENHGEGEMRQTVKITRYDLPNFAVKTKPDRAFYLPGQNAEVEVRADYLFGQPVTKGKVRVVRETDRQWNYKLQKWENEEAESYEGETDATGRFVAKIDLAKAHKDFADYSYRRFQDLSYAVYFTDQTTGRTEQKRFDLRLTREPIHVYFIGADYYQAKGLPMQFYVSASFADGTPAICDITIGQQREKPDSTGIEKTFVENKLRTVKTNRFGLAKVSDLTLPATDDDEFSLRLTANDGKGAIGNHTENLRLRDDTFVRLRMNKAIYLKGEPIELRLISNQPNAVAVLSVAKGFEVLHSQIVRLRNGRAFVVLPYRPEFNDVLSISAISEGTGSSRQNSRSVIYPRDNELKLNVMLDRTEFRPGDEATARFRALTGEGLPVESALGISVIDRAVEERARTNGEFGSVRRHDFVREYLQDSQTVAGITVRDLRKLDVSQPISAELQLAAEVLLINGGYQPRVATSGDFSNDQSRVFRELIDRNLRGLRIALGRQYDKTGEYPRDRESLDRILNIAELNFEELRDPWGNAFRPQFIGSREYDHFSLLCAGADKKFDTRDDFPIYISQWLYFKALGETIQRTAKRLAERDGRITLDAATFKAELKRDGLDFDALRDRWGKPYAIGLTAQGIYWQAAVRSISDGGFRVWSGEVAYFQPMIPRLNSVLEKQFNAVGWFPTSDAMLQAVLKAEGMEFESLRDLWGNQYYGSYLNRILRTNRVSISFDELQKNPQAAKTPQIEKVNFIELRSKGPDGQANTADDFTIAEFMRIKQEQDGSAAPLIAEPQPSASTATGSGAIKGVITDASGAAIAGATAKAILLPGNQEYEARSNADGVYLIGNLPAGTYRMLIASNGFKMLAVEGVPVRSVTLTEVNAVLEVGSVTEQVVVTSDATVLQTESASVSETVTGKQIVNLPLNGRNVANLLALKPGAQITAKSETSTPRLREHFQETLVWQPQLETDNQGRARLKFKLADNITAWKLSVIGSTVDGQIGFAEKEFTAFQPFFAELDPPRVLTEGDEISLPVVLRNYLNKPQTVATEMKPESWFLLLGSPRQRNVVNATDAAKAIFDFRVLTSIKDGKQRVTAIGPDASDAMEKPVTVHPDGEEVAQSLSQLFGERAKFDVTIPGNAIKGSTRAELKIYPNLRAHVLESIEAILERPHGCGEQTISSTYPNLLALKLYALVGGEDSPGAAKAKRYLQAGYDRLRGYRKADGGIGYWPNSESDIALTAYALKFLHDANDFIDVDESTITGARDWLLKQQRTDGSWNKYRFDGDDARGRAMVTAYVAKSLAMIEAQSKTKLAELKRSLEFLSGTIEESNEAYVVASAAMAAYDTGETAIAQKAVGKLQQLAREEAGTTYWTVGSNTPFYSWGRAGQIETTAIAAQVLMRDAQAKTSPLVERSLLFLLRNKDRYGVWHSTQATVNALDALLASETINAMPTAGAHQAEILINGKLATSVAVPAGNKLTPPITVDLSQFVGSGVQQIEIRRPANSSIATAQLVMSHYRPWNAFHVAEANSPETSVTNSMMLKVKYDRSELKIGEEVVCQVEAARVGSYGRGMMLAEIGLPPGADVDRASLETAVRDNGYSINQYDVLTDRIVVYLWPQTGGTKFSFKFKLRYGIKAQSAPSLLYDYYNPEAKAVIAPTRFVVK